MSIQVFLFPEIALGFALKLNSNAHSHLALQLTFGLDGEFVLQQPDDAGQMAAKQVQFACMAPDQLHQIVPPDGDLAYLYLDCDLVSYSRWRDAGGVAVAPDENLSSQLRAFRRSRCGDSQRAQELAQRWRAHSLPGLVRAAALHPRLAPVVEYVDAAPLQAGNHVSLARRANLSPSRFAHLFREHTGLPVRNYVLWRRLLFALNCLQQGQSITTAAYEAGFTDGAHLCRSFRRVFGATPTDLQVQVAEPPPRARSAS